MSAGFTKGPWVVTTCHQGDDCWCRVISTAESAGSDDMDGCVISSGAVNKENAHLIAAAPELYEALLQHAVHEEFDYPGDAPESCGMWCNICNQHVDDDRAGGHAPSCVIAKARGDQ